MAGLSMFWTTVAGDGHKKQFKVFNKKNADGKRQKPKGARWWQKAG